ncbi:MAG: hypothetical protein ABI193_25330 [Minicystis sp.]
MLRFFVVLAAGLLCGGCSDSGADSTGSAPRGDAGGCASDMDCARCCNGANEAANELAVGYVIGACACQDEQDEKAPCAAACTAVGNDLCGAPGAAPSDACIACIQGELDNSASACVQAADAICTKDEACAPLLYCLRGCP